SGGGWRPERRWVASQQAAPASAAVAGGLPDLSAVAGRALQSVMNITSLQMARTQHSPLASDPLFRYFFGDREDILGPRNRVSQSLGSGVVVSIDGSIMPNK